MTELVMNYTVNPLSTFFKSLWKGIVHVNLVIGYSRAASELARMGYYAESKELMMKLKEFKENS